MTQPTSSRHVLPLPLTIADITSDWLTAALRTQAPGVTVNASEVVNIINGTCTKIRIRLEMDEAGKQAGIPETVILKGGFETHSRQMFVTHEKEVRAYRDFLPRFNLRTPACYFAEMDTEARQGIVIIEDLVARGVNFCHPQQPQSHQAVASRLSALAQFHAASWNDAQYSTPEWSWIKDYLMSSHLYMQTYLKPEIWQHYVNSPRGAAASVRFHSREWMADALEKLPRMAANLPRSVILGDTHLGNLYVDRDGTPGFFDPQPLLAPPLVEVAYHVAGALDTADRQRWERSLVQHYLDELGRCGVNPPDFDEAMRQYAAFLVQGYCIFMINATDFQTEAINTVYTARFSAAMLDNDTLGVLAAFR